MPEPVWKRILEIGHHSRPECLSRPGEWCRAIGQHPGVCAKCPLRGARNA